MQDRDEGRDGDYVVTAQWIGEHLLAGGSYFGSVQAAREWAAGCLGVDPSEVEVVVSDQSSPDPPPQRALFEENGIAGV
jgi:hypothetical protein